MGYVVTIDFFVVNNLILLSAFFITLFCRLGDVNRGYSGRVGSEQYPGLPQLAFHHALFGTGRNISGCCSLYSELLKAINRNDLFVTFHPMGRSEWPEPSQ